MAIKFPTRKNMTIDLLPESVQKRKQFRRLVIRLATLQVAIFLCLGAAIFGVNALESRAWANSHELNLRIYTLRHGPYIEALAHARDIGQLLAAEDDFIRSFAPADFDPLWIKAIMQADDGNMTALDYGGTSILVTGVTARISTIEAHRQSILSTQMFRYVSNGRIILQEDGLFLYELRVVVG